ncbi:MAG: LPS-assembly protein LptD [Paludibacteraceae bacterium]|nr:LPS-assembly protein LptD [Paludibacteraceae bacterium]
MAAWPLCGSAAVTDTIANGTARTTEIMRKDTTMTDSLRTDITNTTLKADTIAASATDTAATQTADTAATQTADTTATQTADTAAIAAAEVKPAPKQQSALDAPVSYTAKDSVVLLANGTVMLHGDGKVNYQKMELTSAYIRANLDSSLIYARGRYDEQEEEVKGKPVFKDGKDSYESNEINYNLKTRKGYIRGVVTEQGEGYIVADRTKKTDGDVLTMAGGKYTTCNQHDHPHFYLKLTKAKVKPGDYIASGPAYMVLGDIPTPLFIPFGYFPFSTKYASGLIMPTFGDDYSRGLYLRGLGYYFAINDYIDLEVTGDIYSRGTWALYANANYVKRYKFRGSININYRNDVTGDKGLPDYRVGTNLRIAWTHQQDAKANPYNNFSASVNLTTSGYNRSNINSYYNSRLNSENTKSSSINYTQRFPNSPWTVSLSALLSQQTRDSTITATLPDLSVNMSSVYPFKRKVRTGKERWYEKIKLSYSGNAKISVSNIKERLFFKSDFLRDWRTGLKHSVPISATWTVLKYLSITPTFSMTDRMYFSRIDQSWNNETQSLQRDTVNGFYNVFDFNASLRLSTKLYGFYTPVRKLFGNKVDRFRHVLTPELSVNYHPDFGKSFWGYYGSYDQPLYSDSIDAATGLKMPRLDAAGVPMYQTNTYSRFSNGLYGNAARGLNASLHFGLQNNIEVKVRNDKDTTGKAAYKVYSVIDNFGISGGYNFAADSMNWENFNVQLRLKIPVVNYTINLSGQFDPYMYELNAAGQPVRTNKQYWHNHRFPHFLGTSFSISYTLNNQKIKQWFNRDKKKNGKHEEEEEDNLDPLVVNEDGTINNGKRHRHTHSHAEETDSRDEDYVKTEIPWNLNIGYSIYYTQVGGFDYDKMYPKMGIKHAMSLSGTIALGSGWKMTASTNIDFTAMKVSYTNFTVSRDLHCWNMSASFVPFGPYKSYTFHIGVNASMLKDLKYDKNSADNTNKRVTWW